MWNKFAKNTMPEVNNGRYFLICRGYWEPGGGVMCIGKRVKYDDDEPYIRYIGFVGGDRYFDWMVLEPEDYRQCLWQEIEYPWRWYVVRADYRPESDRSPKYYFKTSGDKRYVRDWFNEHYSWLAVYEVREVAEQDTKGH